jgi:hypothetical protein
MEPPQNTEVPKGGTPHAATPSTDSKMMRLIFKIMNWSHEDHAMISEYRKTMLENLK